MKAENLEGFHSFKINDPKLRKKNFEVQIILILNILNLRSILFERYIYFYRKMEF